MCFLTHWWISQPHSPSRWHRGNVMLGGKVVMLNVICRNGNGSSEYVKSPGLHWPCTLWDPHVAERAQASKSLTGTQILVPSLPFGSDTEQTNWLFWFLVSLSIKWRSKYFIGDYLVYRKQLSVLFPNCDFLVVYGKSEYSHRIFLRPRVLGWLPWAGRTTLTYLVIDSVLGIFRFAGLG